MGDNKKISLVECPRDAMQGWKEFIPTAQKIKYISALLKVGFDVIDFGSFVSPKAIPQMADTKQVVDALDLSDSVSTLLAIVANTRGAEEAAGYEKIESIGFPFSISETFQQRNTNSSIEQSLETVARIQEICTRKDKEAVIYISMGFGNPYGDAWSEQIVFGWVEKIASLGIKTISLADTVGLATSEQVFQITKYLVDAMPAHEIGVHLHSSPFNWQEKAGAAIRAGCKRMDGALRGVGGCPMADDELVGNMDTEKLIPYFQGLGIQSEINEAALAEASFLAAKIFS
ncbi:MAG: hydroxymethylglutaryl-CoA lyase [Gemmatimonadaceae bacterium]|nr:hydroxymethylglutaryl-CoA lyase [Chitinophagaceae bacterium]